jgi:hypothetical protein
MITKRFDACEMRLFKILREAETVIFYMSIHCLDGIRDDDGKTIYDGQAMRDRKNFGVTPNA